VENFQGATHVPVHEVKVQVVGTELLQGVLDSELDVLWVVVNLEQLGSDEELFTGDTGLLDTLSDLAFVLVAPSTAGNQYMTHRYCGFPPSGEERAEDRNSLNVPVTGLFISFTSRPEARIAHLDSGFDSLSDLSGTVRSVITPPEIVTTLTPIAMFPDRW
jgi:hypothetical protein